jgi:hypothetical protein
MSFKLFKRIGPKKKRREPKREAEFFQEMLYLWKDESS